MNKPGCNATVTSMIVCCGFVVCWLPCQLTYIFAVAGFRAADWFYHFSCLLYQFSRTFSPIVLSSTLYDHCLLACNFCQSSVRPSLLTHRLYDHKTTTVVFLPDFTAIRLHRSTLSNRSHFGYFSDKRHYFQHTLYLYHFAIGYSTLHSILSFL